MKNPFNRILDWVAKNFRKDASKMIIATGVAGWTLSSLAQISAIVFNPKISNDKKSFLVPQEFADAAANIGSFFLITLMVKKLTSKLFSTGKLAPKSLRKCFKKYPDIFEGKIGKLDFKVDDYIKKIDNFPKDEYYAYKNFGTTIATVGAGIVSSNIVTPILRNEMASNMQKNYINNKKNLENRQQCFKSHGLRV